MSMVKLCDVEIKSNLRIMGITSGDLKVCPYRYDCLIITMKFQTFKRNLGPIEIKLCK